jgi:hypothetical protein
MKSHNHNDAITHLAMPERQIPVLIDSAPEKAEGFVPSVVWSEKPVTSVRRLLPSFVEGLESPRKRKEIEKEHGAIDPAEWGRLREMLALKDRLNAGDWSPVIALNADALAPLPALLDRLSPGGWFREDEPGTGIIKLRSASGDVQGSLAIEIGKIKRIELGKPPSAAPVAGTSVRKTALSAHLGLERGRKNVARNLEFNGKIGVEVRTAAFALSKAFTVGLSRTRFVVWWHDATKRFVPGLYCPDIVTALYALAMWSSGTAGGWAICQRCKKDYPRSRAKQRYCSHKCQVAAAMQRLRDKRKLKAESKPKVPTESKKRTGKK